MPELPEIEHLKRTLEPWLVGSRVTDVQLHRRDIVRRARSRAAIRGVQPSQLLAGATIDRLERRGKSLAVVAKDDRGVLVLHMGMTGAMVVAKRDGETKRRRDKPAQRDRHVHCVWTLRRTDAPRVVRLAFRDPRRFGGLWPFASMDDLHERSWSRLGPDALTIDAQTLRERLLRTRQPMKAALLNQALIAGVGNIYADESLFAAGVHPLARPQRVNAQRWESLAESIRRILQAAIDSGGSTISSYRDATGQAGAFAHEHRVYGRGGLPCVACGDLLMQRVIGQRTAVWCERCQARSDVNRRAVEPEVIHGPSRPVRAIASGRRQEHAVGQR